MTKKEKREMMLGEKIRKSLEEVQLSMPRIGLYDESGKLLNQVVSDINEKLTMGGDRLNQLVSDINEKYEDS